SGALVERCIGFNPLSFTAVRKPERRLDRVLELTPNAIGLMLASLVLIPGRSSAIRAGSFAKKAGNSLHRRAQVTQPGSGDRGIALQGDDDVRQGDRCGESGPMRGTFRLTLDGHVLGPFGKPGLGHQRSREDSGWRRWAFGHSIMEYMERLFDGSFPEY